MYPEAFHAGIISDKALPYDYKVEYVESGGGLCFFSTERRRTLNTKYVFEIYTDNFLDTIPNTRGRTYPCIFGSEFASVRGMLRVNNSSGTHVTQFYCPNNNDVGPNSVVNGVWIRYVIDRGELSSSLSSEKIRGANYSTDYYEAVFACGYNNDASISREGIATCAFMKLRKFEIYENDVLVKNAVMCVKDGNAEMYDEIGKSFWKRYGYFVAGNRI